MGITRDIDKLTPEARIKCIAFKQKCEEQGIPIYVNETLRSQTTQLIYYHQGRLDVANNKNIVKEFNTLRKENGFWELSEKEALEKIITWTFYSNHMTGKAFDAVPLKDGRLWWNAPEDVWEKIGTIGESVGLMWGGRWPERKKDSPHFETI